MRSASMRHRGWILAIMAAGLSLGSISAQDSFLTKVLFEPVKGGNLELVQGQSQTQPPQTLPRSDVVAPRQGSGTGNSGQAPGSSLSTANPGDGGIFGNTNSIPWDSNAITSDSDRVGPYGQPAWTTQRPFSSVRTYVLPPGQAQLEEWYRPRWKRGGDREDRILSELAIGLPNRFQLDLYWRSHIEKNDAGNYEFNHEGVMIEMRYAFADWGKLFLNPTFYAEWVQRGNREGEPDKYELKFLLSDSFFCDRIFWAANFIMEKEVGGDQATEFGFSQAISTTIIERKLMAGIEMWYRTESVSGHRDLPSQEILIGPTVQWRPTNRTYLNISPLFGVTNDAPKVEMFVIFGYQFGARSGPSGGITPASLGS